MASEHFGPCSKKGRGRAQRSLDLIEAMYAIAKAAQPITGRGVGYKLFVVKLIPSMDKPDLKPVYRLLKEAREEGIIPWEWIVDETRELEKVGTWRDPASFVRTVSNAYRRDFWRQQPVRVEVWSEKGTVRGVLQPVLDKYGVGFRVMHGFSGATSIYDVAQSNDERPLIILYVGDYDPNVHVGTRLAQQAQEVWWPPCVTHADCCLAGGLGRLVIIPGVRQREGHPLRVVRPKLRG